MLANHPIAPPDEAIAVRIAHELDGKTKPPGSLGRLEKLAMALGAAQATQRPAADPATLLLFAADHGIVAEGVSAWPQEVTAGMVANFMAGGAAASVLARTSGARIVVADAGVVGAVPDLPGLRRATIRAGTRNAAREDALTPEEVAAALRFGAALAHEAVSEGARAVLLGEMGIGNTSTAALLGHGLTGLGLERLVGPGAGLGPAGIAAKHAVLVRAVARRPGPLNAEAALSAFGGLEIAAMSGALIAAASGRAVVLVDGFIATVAAAAALSARPEARAYCIFAHRGAEPGHGAMLDWLGADPLLDLGLRLGEGTGALLALPVLRAACAILSDMASFESAGLVGGG